MKDGGPNVDPLEGIGYLSPISTFMYHSMLYSWLVIFSNKNTGNIKSACKNVTSEHMPVRVSHCLWIELKKNRSGRKVLLGLSDVRRHDNRNP